MKHNAGLGADTGFQGQRCLSGAGWVGLVPCGAPGMTVLAGLGEARMHGKKILNQL